MRVRRLLLGAGAVVLGLPLLVALIGIASIAIRDRTNGAIVSSGETRRYLLHVPGRYDPTRRTPLVISLHPGATWPAYQMHTSGWNRLADAHGFIVVYPAGSDLPGVPGRSLIGAKMWHTFEPGAGLERDVRFIADLIDTLEATYTIDPLRIYANGLSNGGGMAYVLACTLADRIAAVGLVAAAQSLPPAWCSGPRAVPVTAFHGDADRFVPYAGGPLGDPFNPVKPVFPPVEDWIARWAKRNRCATGPIESKVAPDVRRLEYQDCAADAEVVLYTLLGGGHAWPGGKPPPRWRVGPTNTSIDATAVLWAFFLEHPLQVPTPSASGGTPDHESADEAR